MTLLFICQMIIRSMAINVWSGERKYAFARRLVQGKLAFSKLQTKYMMFYRPGSGDTGSGDTSKRLHRNKTRITKEFDPNFAIIGTADCGKCRCITHEGT